VIGEGATMKTLFLLDPTVRKAEERKTLEKMGCADTAKRRCGVGGL